MAKKRAAKRANSAASSLAAISQAPPRPPASVGARSRKLCMISARSPTQPSARKPLCAGCRVGRWAAALERVRGETSDGIAVAAQERRVQAIATGASDFQTACEATEAIDLVVPLAIGHH